MSRLAERMQIVGGFVPVDMQTAANPGDYISFKNHDHCTIIIYTAIGTGGDDPVISLVQATSVAAAGAKALNISEVFYKVGATALSAVGTFTRATQTAAATYDTAGIDGAENEAIFVLEIDAAQLDTDNDFDCLRVNIADVGSNAQLGCALYVMSDSSYNGIEAIT